jgi:hypothetical protein
VNKKSPLPEGEGEKLASTSICSLYSVELYLGTDFSLISFISAPFIWPIGFKYANNSLGQAHLFEKDKKELEAIG